MSAPAGQRTHEQGHRALPKRVVAAEPLYRLRGLVRPAGGQQQLCAGLERLGAQLLHTGRLWSDPLVLGHLVVSRPAPQAQRGVKQAEGSVGFAELSTSRSDEHLEPGRVDPLGAAGEAVVGPRGLHPGAGRAQRSAQTGHMGVQGSQGVGGRLRRPQCVDQLTGGHDLPRARDQHRQQQPLTPAAQPHGRRLAGEQHHRSEHPDPRSAHGPFPSDPARAPD